MAFPFIRFLSFAICSLKRRNDAKIWVDFMKTNYSLIMRTALSSLFAALQTRPQLFKERIVISYPADITYYKHSILKLIYKMYFNDSPPCMTAHIAKSQPSYNLRNSLKLEIPKFKSNIKKSSVSYRGAILWNLLPSGCRMADGVNSFSKIINNLTLVKDINFANIYCRR